MTIIPEMIAKSRFMSSISGNNYDGNDVYRKLQSQGLNVIRAIMLFITTPLKPINT